MATRYSQYRAVKPALVEHRAAERHRVYFTSATVQRGHRRTEAMLHDLSIYGCRLACRSRHPEGARLLLSLRGGDPIIATVVWNDGAHLGCRFEKPIERSLVRTMTLVIC